MTITSEECDGRLVDGWRQISDTCQKQQQSASQYLTWPAGTVSDGCRSCHAVQVISGGVGARCTDVKVPSRRKSTLGALAALSGLCVSDASSWRATCRQSRASSSSRHDDSGSRTWYPRISSSPEGDSSTPQHQKAFNRPIYGLLPLTYWHACFLLNVNVMLWSQHIQS